MIKNNLRRERNKRKLSLSKIAIQAGLSPSTLSEFELGKRIPWPKARAALAQVLKVPEPELFPEED
jgi:transcriptional regulator with XRE-family HTH domain